MTLYDLIDISKEYELELTIVTLTSAAIRGYVVSITSPIENELGISEICVRDKTLRYPASDVIVPLDKIDHVTVFGDFDMWEEKLKEYEKEYDID